MLEKTFLRRLSEYKNWNENPGTMYLGVYDPNMDIVEHLSEYVTFQATPRSGASITINCEVPSVEECLSEFPAEWSNADRELALYIMLKGQYHEFYGSHDSKTMGKFAELVITGVDWQYSTTPDSQQWQEFAGTFAESHNSEDVLALTLVKHDENNDGYALYGNEYNFGIEMSSIAQIIKASSGFFLNQL
jgi:hypothetical protein